MDRRSIFEKEKLLILNKKIFYFKNKMVFEYVKNFLFENKKLFNIEKIMLGIAYCENILKIFIFFFQKGTV